MRTRRGVWFVPVTPGDTALIYGAGARSGKLNAAPTEDEAWRNLLEDAAHMPYADKAAFVERGYTVEKWDDVEL